MKSLVGVIKGLKTLSARKMTAQPVTARAGRLAGLANIVR